MDDIGFSKIYVYSIWSASLTFILSLCAFVLCAVSIENNNVVLATAAATVILSGIGAVIAWKRYIDERITR